MLCVVDKQFECASVVLLKRIKDMLNKYRKQLLAESQVTNGVIYIKYHLTNSESLTKVIVLKL